MSDCIHRGRQCQSVRPGVSKCECGQVFVYIHRSGVGRYKKAEELTDEDFADMADDKDFLDFCSEQQGTGGSN